MFDGIKIIDLSVSTDALLQNDRLTFPLSIDERTGTILNRPRRDIDQGLSFMLIPRKKGGLRCELTGSLHRYHNGGTNNANDFTVTSLLATINDLVVTYGINPFMSRLNNIEFGVNIQLPFPVSNLLKQLICYRGIPFVRDSDNGGIYYQATLKQYAVKMYDKGRQYSLSGNVIRVEVKVFKMQFLETKGIFLHTMADLLRTENYPKLGRLLLATFSTILFDDSTVSLDRLSNPNRERLLQGRNPRNWQLPARETFVDQQDYNRERKRLQRQEKRFRSLLTTYRKGDDWQVQTELLIRDKWTELTIVSNELQLVIRDQLAGWEINSKSYPKCPNITGSKNGKVSQYYPLGLG